MVVAIDHTSLEPMPWDPNSAFSPLQTYSDWEFAWWREVLQNAVDAIMMRRKRLEAINFDTAYRPVIEIEHSNTDEITTIKVRDSGIGMDQKTLYQALLSFGGSAKEDVDGATGGFGKAKELIFVPWLQWEVETTWYDAKDNVAKTTKAVGRHFDRQRKDTTQVTVVEGSQNNPLHKSIGTTLTVVMGPEKLNSRDFNYQVGLRAIYRILARSYIPGLRLMINGEQQTMTQGPRVYATANQAPVRQETFYFQKHVGHVYIFVDKAKREYEDIIVRQNGLYMFSAGDQPSGIKGSVRIECSGSAFALYTDNRDGLKYSCYISNLVAKLAVDGVYGLLKDRRGITLSLSGTDISTIQDERIKQVAQNRAERLRQMVKTSLNQSLQVTESDNDEKHEYTLEKAEERREELKRSVEKVIVADFEEANQQEEQENVTVAGSPEWARRICGKVDVQTISQTLNAMPVRLTAEQFVKNNFWTPRQVIRSELGREVVPDSYWLRGNSYPERYPFMLLDFWTNLVRLCAVTIGVDLTDYSTGFVFGWDEDGDYPIGLHMISDKHGKSILINPTRMRPKTNSDGNTKYTRYGEISSFSHVQRWKLSKRNHLEELLSIAIHEVTHAQGYGEHNDKFASALTRNMAAIMPRGVRMLGSLMAGTRKRWQAIEDAKNR